MSRLRRAGKYRMRNSTYFLGATILQFAMFFLLMAVILPLAGFSLIILSWFNVGIFFLIFLIGRLFLFIMTGFFTRPQSSLGPSKYVASFTGSIIFTIIVYSTLLFGMIVLLNMFELQLLYFSTTYIRYEDYLLIFGAILMSEIITYYGARLMYTGPYTPRHLYT